MNITDDDYRRARHITEAAAQLLQQAIRPDRRGRPGLHPRIYLTGAVLAIDTCASATVTDIHTVLTRDLPRDLQWDLGVLTTAKDGTVRPITQTDLYNLTRRITKQLDHTKIRAGHLGDDERYRRRELLDAISDAILAATLIPRPAGSTSYALDGTGIWAAEKAPNVVDVVDTPDRRVEVDDDQDGNATSPSNPDEELAEAEDPETGPRRGKRGPSDAGYGVKTAKDGRRKSYYGYETHAFVRVPEVKANDPAQRSEPLLVEKIVVLPASVDPVGPCLRVIERSNAVAGTLTRLLVDRHYSYKKFHRWLKNLTCRGIDQVADMHPKDQGFRDWDGMRMAASWPHCPATPDDLGTIPTLGPNATKSEREDFQDKITRRFAYAAERRSQLDGDGKIRYRCPARAGKTGCPLVDGSIAAATELGLPIIANPPGEEGRPAICRQQTVQLKAETDEQQMAMKMHQKHYWGSDPWRLDYNRRTYVEGWFGVLKNNSATGTRRGSHQYVGLPLVTLVISVAAAVTNLRLLHTWHQQTGFGDERHPLLQPDKPHYGSMNLTKEQAEAIDALAAEQLAA